MATTTFLNSRSLYGTGGVDKLGRPRMLAGSPSNFFDSIENEVSVLNSTAYLSGDAKMEKIEGIHQRPLLPVHGRELTERLSMLRRRQLKGEP